ncbi:Portal protein [Levilactobacillus senmaizukei DSM 21775 = NBRC 103853]|uniref:Portal protein n=2 Tax=Levilactobacillus senmaizukei TaxID=431273 RepID=A0A0R2DMP9_9LACO|nr:Portal protein [Levilactobacillus senmaizukei DSM 21775 = NBRC 103853]
MKSSDVNELVNDISNQIAMAKPTVIGPDGEEVPNHAVLKLLKHPNEYQTGFEFSKLQVNTLLLRGEVFPAYLGNELHLVSDVSTDLNDRLVETYKVGGTNIPGSMIEHVKQVNTSALQGQGLAQLGKDTLEGVMSAEKVLTDKYAKGGLLAFLLKLDSHLNPANATQSQLVTAIKGQLEGLDNQDTVKMLTLGKGYEIDTLRSPVEDDKILAYLNVYKKDLGKYLGINVDTYQHMMENDVEKSMMYLHNKAVRPILQNLSEHYTQLLFSKDSGYHIEWKINILDFVPYSVKTNIGYNIVRTGITSPDNVAEMLGFEPQNTKESQAIYISNDLMNIGDKSATDNSLPTKGGDNDENTGN